MDAEHAESFERRFGGLRRLYGIEGAQRVFDAHLMVVGIGGVGSWAAEALARSGVGRLTLVDLDHVSESNTNRQIHALGDAYGRAKVDAMRERVLAIHPGAQVQTIDDFVTPDNWAEIAEQRCGGRAVDGVIDACDQVSAKVAMARWALAQGRHLVSVGAAGGKRHAERVEVADLSATTHDPLLAQLRYRLRREQLAARDGAIGIECVFSRETVKSPEACDGPGDGSLSCHGYGSVVSVTATFGLCAAGTLIDHLAAARKPVAARARRAAGSPKKHAII